MEAIRLAVLVSGSGTILEVMIESGIEVAVVVSDRPCRALEIAESHGIEGLLVDRHEFGGFSKNFDREGYTVALRDVLEGRSIDLIAMAGFGTITTGTFYERFAGRVLNTHPSLLPLYKGWHAVTAALDDHASESGCTVHIATEELDDGPILAQRRVPILANDTEESLHERIKAVERTLYPEVVAAVLKVMAQGDAAESVRLDGLAHPN